MDYPENPDDIYCYMDFDSVKDLQFTNSNLERTIGRLENHEYDLEGVDGPGYYIVSNKVTLKSYRPIFKNGDGDFEWKYIEHKNGDPVFQAEKVSRTHFFAFTNLRGCFIRPCRIATDDLHEYFSNKMSAAMHRWDCEEDYEEDDEKEQEFIYERYKEEANWPVMARRALAELNASPEVLSWQYNNRTTMPTLAAFYDGLSDAYEVVNKKLECVKEDLHDSLETRINSVEQRLVKDDLSFLTSTFEHAKRATYRAGDVAVDLMLPNSMEDIGMACVNVALSALGMSALNKGVEKTQLAFQAYKKIQKIAQKPPINRIQHEALKTQYRQNMECPPIKDSKLSQEIGKLYRKNAEIGSGSTADAARYEIATGNKIKGKYHVEKTQDSIKYFEKWLDNNPTADTGDRATVENVLKDLQDALGNDLKSGDRPWYSQAKPPK